MLRLLRGRETCATGQHCHQREHGGVAHTFGGQQPAGERGGLHEAKQPQQPEHAGRLEARRQERRRQYDVGEVERVIAQPPPAIEAFVDRASAGDGDAAAEWVHDDAEFELPGNKSLPTGSAGAQALASRHVEVEGRLISVELKSAEAVRENCWVARLLFVNREIASGETMYEMEVGGLFELRHDRVARFRAFPSPEEAVAAAALGGRDG